VTVAVKVTDWPKVLGLREEVRETVTGLSVTLTVQEPVEAAKAPVGV
jgi:hypothetical protein